LDCGGKAGAATPLFGRTEILRTGKTFQACASGVALRFPPQSITQVLKKCSFKFEVRQNMLQISNSLQRERHFCFDANPYPTGRRGLRRNRNVWVAASSDLSHFKLESTK
jgi:hypothetical protein